jgi:uncharacterized protein YcbX
VQLGTIRSMSRFPVKSMLGEDLERASLVSTGIVGDRALALVDTETGKVASAKDPRRWAGLLTFRARYEDPHGDATSVVVFELPDGSTVRSDDPGLSERLRAATGRPVRLVTDPTGGVYDMVWEPDIAPDEIVKASQSSMTDDGRPVTAAPLGMDAPGTFQDVAPITLLTTGALRRMAALHPDGSWHPARFRSNFLIETDGDEVLENDWPGRRLRIGSAELEVTTLAPRCVMTTLPQPGLDRDRSILRTVAQHNRRPFGELGLWACLGAYARVVTPGVARRGDEVVSID